MFEIAGTRFEKGVFEIQLEKKLPQPLARIASLGPYGGRLVGLILIVSASFVGLSEHSLLANHPALSPAIIRAAQYALALIGLMVYLVIFLVRNERLELKFDRSHAELRVLLTPLFAKKALLEGLIPFRNIKALKVVAPTGQPLTANGYLEMVTVAPENDPFRVIRFAFMTAEQRQFFPLNLSQMTGIEPTGDWKES